MGGTITIPQQHHAAIRVTGLYQRGAPPWGTPSSSSMARTLKGTRRVQLVREEGRDASS